MPQAVSDSHTNVLDNVGWFVNDKEHFGSRLE